ncbi:hypothetical protein EPR50_G00156200 [Perca flavescens]|uniref:Ig-like domain-containing protein n=1 Tax=Perca flavescens TaxID=8167 RepID=A0A484CNM7_PERFV|nr:hypothetical protein EPR50_G00156200 [Perca flavescens]
MVTVTSATPTAPAVFPLIQCGSGTGDITLGCLATGFTPSSLTYAWNKNGAALTDFIKYPPVQKGNVYTGVSQIRVSRQDWDARETFKCAVEHASGQPQEVIFRKIVVPCYPPTLSVLASSDEGTEASFSCFAKDFSPKDYEIKWLKNEEEIVNKINEIQTRFEGRVDDNGTAYSAASFLTVKSEEMPANTQVTCEFKGKSGACPTKINSTVIYQPKLQIGDGACLEKDVEIDIIEPTMEDMFSEGKGNITCQVKINKPSVTEISWETHNGKPIHGASVSPPQGSKGVFRSSLPITYDEWSKGTKFVCIVIHDNVVDPLKKTYGRTVGGQIQRPSVFMLPPLEQTKKETVTLTCYVKDFFPQEVFVSWLVDDVKADSKFKFHTTNPVENQGSYSVYSQLSLTLEEWQDSDMVYSCVVHHESVVNTNKAIVRSIGHRTFEKTNLVNLNMNIPETCKA